jgi:hypothetical protein
VRERERGQESKGVMMSERGREGNEVFLTRKTEKIILRESVRYTNRQNNGLDNAERGGKWG